jgi:hypothetical protein
MRIITNSELPNAMNEVQPNRIAVAYVGIDWNLYIDKDKLAEIIVSPTLGSNPRAIEQLVELLGWDRVHFLDELHAKIYIGKDKAAFGSFNLSRNGISVDGLEELGGISQESIVVERLTAEFLRLREKAIARYPTVQKKESRLSDLSRLRNRAIEEGILKDDNSLIQIEDYSPKNSIVMFVCWWIALDPERDFAILSAVDPKLSAETFDSVSENYTTALESDKIEPGSWLLMWKARADGMPYKNSKPYWLYVHEAIPHGIKGDDYSRLLLQRKDMITPTAPFDIDRKDVARELRTVLSMDEFASFRLVEGKLWSTQDCAEDTSRLIAAVKSACRKGASHK